MVRSTAAPSGALNVESPTRTQRGELAIAPTVAVHRPPGDEVRRRPGSRALDVGTRSQIRATTPPSCDLPTPCRRQPSWARGRARKDWSIGAPRGSSLSIRPPTWIADVGRTRLEVDFVAAPPTFGAGRGAVSVERRSGDALQPDNRPVSVPPSPYSHSDGARSAAATVPRAAIPTVGWLRVHRLLLGQSGCSPRRARTCCSGTDSVTAVSRPRPELYVLSAPAR